MIVEIDIGNSWAKWRTINADGQKSAVQRVAVGDFPDGVFLALRDVRQVRIACVAAVETLNRVCAAIREQWQLEPGVARTASELAGVRNAYTDPDRMGVDRWLAMVAAWKTAQSGCLVVDCGSAINMEFVNADGVNEGGYIVPGLMLMRQSLLQGTGQVKFDPADYRPSTAPGASTAEAVEHGGLYMAVALVEAAWRDCCERWSACELFLTGGDAALLAPHLQVPHRVEPALVLDGLVFALP